MIIRDQNGDEAISCYEPEPSHVEYSDYLPGTVTLRISSSTGVVTMTILERTARAIHSALSVYIEDSEREKDGSADTEDQLSTLRSKP